MSTIPSEVELSSLDLVPGDFVLFPTTGGYTVECDAVLVEGSCVVGHSVRDWSCMVGNGMMHWGRMMSNGMVEWSSMMSDSMVNRRSMMDHSMVWVSMSHNWRRDGVAILIEDGFGQVWVEEGVGVEAVEGHCCAAVHRVPELAP